MDLQEASSGIDQASRGPITMRTSGTGPCTPMAGTRAPRKLVRNRAGGYGCPPGWIPDTRTHERKKETTKANDKVRHPRDTSKSASSGSGDQDAHSAEAGERLAAKEEDENRGRETQSLSAKIAALAPPPPCIPPSVAQGLQRSRPPRQWCADARCPCTNGCGRAASAGYGACCRTCNATNGSSHGPRCNAMFWQAKRECPWRRTGLFDEW